MAGFTRIARNWCGNAHVVLIGAPDRATRLIQRQAAVDEIAPQALSNAFRKSSRLISAWRQIVRRVEPLIVA